MSDETKKYYQIMFKPRGLRYCVIFTVRKKRVYSDNSQFDKLKSILETDVLFKESLKHLVDYNNLIIVYGIHETHTIEKHVKKYKVQHQPILQSTQNNLIMFKHIEYPENKQAETFEQMFLTKNNNNISEFNKCFINLIVETYAEQINKKDVIRVKKTVGKTDSRFKCEKCQYYTKNVTTTDI